MGRLGVHKIATAATELGCLFHKVDQENDIGNDAYIELIEECTNTSFCIAAQIKAGNSYVRANQIDTFIKSDKTTLSTGKTSICLLLVLFIIQQAILFPGST